MFYNTFSAQLSCISFEGFNIKLLKDGLTYYKPPSAYSLMNARTALKSPIDTMCRIDCFQVNLILQFIIYVVHLSQSSFYNFTLLSNSIFCLGWAVQRTTPSKRRKEIIPGSLSFPWAVFFSLLLLLEDSKSLASTASLFVVAPAKTINTIIFICVFDLFS